MDKALAIKEDLRFQFPDLGDFELATDYFEISSDLTDPFKRSVSVKLPTNNDGFTEEYK